MEKKKNDDFLRLCQYKVTLKTRVSISLLKLCFILFSKFFKGCVEDFPLWPQGFLW